MPEFHDDSFTSCNGTTSLRVRTCYPASAPRAVVQISHGIAEHVERYDAFAAFLANHGIVVVANDHLGHGKSVSDPSELGFFASRGGWELAVGDMRRLYDRTHTAFPQIPYFLFGHSMGSFLTRTFLIKYRDGLAGAILSGTGWQDPRVAAAGKRMAEMEIRRHGVKYKSVRLNNMAFGNYNDCFDTHRTVSDWLSRDEAAVDRYIADPLCGFLPTAGLFRDMMGGIGFICTQKNLTRMKKDLPIYFMSGDMDPVGANGKGVLRTYERFLKAGMNDVTLKLYHNGRHELLNELNREKVFADTLAWINGNL